MGRLVRARLGALLGNVVATHKVAGFSSHSAKKPCSWCHVSNTELSAMRIGHLRNRMATLAAARTWRNSDCAERKKLVKKSGVQMSELNRLPYWDPVNQVVLGVMHNWFEGVLQHHFRFRWGLNGTTQTTDEELEESDYYTAEDDAMDEGGISSTFWSDTIKNKLINAVLEVVVPTGVTQMPRGFGTAKNGKLKASEWHTLFAIHLPLASLDIFIGRDIEESLRRNEQIITNLCDLVQCTNIVSSKAITRDDCNIFEEAYKTYTDTSARLFPNLKILPNHHYALHIPQQLRWWGPLMAVSEFPGERLIGFLQKCKTNANPMLGHIGVTIMNKFCQLQRLKAQQGLDCAYEEKERIKRGTKFEMDLTAYNKILLFLRESTPELCANSELPHPPNAKVLFNYAKSIISAECAGGKDISRQQPNDMIEYVADGHTCYGQVAEIVELAGAVEGLPTGPTPKFTLLMVLCHNSKYHKFD
ncbi:hypothetical protein VP01_3690g2 [Puccinia sorghi]|uniref:Uncharacterized protein n=1 Tax=Puccinia sorghi TaxID=27349 RepID=A0A0L6UU91_9BASI|nr:hypothetical protein VP01_3690g2 [Puccinia sorghi]